MGSECVEVETPSVLNSQSIEDWLSASIDLTRIYTLESQANRRTNHQYMIRPFRNIRCDSRGLQSHSASHACQHHEVWEYPSGHSQASSRPRMFASSLLQRRKSSCHHAGWCEDSSQPPDQPFREWASSSGTEHRHKHNNWHSASS